MGLAPQQLHQFQALPAIASLQSHMWFATLAALAVFPCMLIMPEAVAPHIAFSQDEPNSYCASDVWVEGGKDWHQHRPEIYLTGLRPGISSTQAPKNLTVWYTPQKRRTKTGH